MVIQGTNLGPGTFALCRFGSESVPALVLSSTRATCRAPPATFGFESSSLTDLASASPSRMVAVTFSNDGGTTFVGPAFGGRFQSSNGTLQADEQLPDSTIFTYSEVLMDGLVPESGPRAGGYNATVSGFGFQRLQRPRCVFAGVVYSEASVVSDQVLTCRVPALPRHGKDSDSGGGRGGDVVGFELREQAPATQTDRSSAATISDIIANKLTFRYTPNPSTTMIVPASGPVSGGTKVGVYGRHYRETASLSCSFGGTMVDAVFLSSTHLECAVPPLDQVNRTQAKESQVAVEVKVFVGGVPVQPTSMDLIFLFVLDQRSNVSSGVVEEPASVGSDVSDSPGASTSPAALVPLFPFSTRPTSGPASGGTRVIVQGPDIPRAVGLGCKFGELSSTPTTPARFWAWAKPRWPRVIWTRSAVSPSGWRRLSIR